MVERGPPKPRLVSAREAAGSGEAPPTPARALLGSTDDQPDVAVDPDVPAVELEVEGRRWSVTVLGRAVAGQPPSWTEVMLLGFTPADGSDAVALESWVVGSALRALPVPVLEAALEEARPPPKAPPPSERSGSEDRSRNRPRR